MSIKLRLAFLLGGLLVGFLALLAGLRWMENRALAQLLAAERETQAQLLNHWIDLTNRTLPQFAAEAAQSEEFSRLVAADDDAARERLAASLATAGVHALWIVRADGTARTAIAAPGASVPAALPLAPEEFVRVIAEATNPRFFAAPEGPLLELCVRRLGAPGEGARDWVIVARTWDEAQLRSLAALTESAVSLGGPEALAHAPAAGQIVLVRPLADWRGHPLRTLRLEYHPRDTRRAVQDDWRQALLLVGFGLLLLVAVGLALHAWVLRPLGRIGESLARDDPRPVETMGPASAELARLAQLVLASFAQREALARSEAALRRTLDERARLGRDLHDGVIQSLYASGMGLAGVRALLRPEQLEAAARLEQTRALLNETIHDVRNFIIGLEPEALKLQTFGQAVNALLATMHGIRLFQSEIAIDEELARRLSLAQRVHALQITREAVSNALRHGAANHLAIALRPAGNFAEFVITDDGCGFDAGGSAAPGQGLKNLAERARELNAELTVDSRPGHGARVKLVFASPIYD